VRPSSSDGPRTILAQDFDDTPPGEVPAPWAVTAPAGAITVAPAPNSDDQVLRVENPAGEQPWARHDFEPTFDDLTLSYRVRASQTNDSQGIHLGLAGDPISPDMLASVDLFSNGQLRVRDGSTHVDVQPYTIDTWYDIELRVRQMEDTFDLLIDGEPVVQDASVR
ncbi:hypothetical protein, partial [Phytoactinopolyspora endophytica]|uniref:hypothetical protein n=1 Tax=Phytoactinopolyspora endophytica TaxID=1642495 RepID=UPI0013EDC1FA